MTAVKRLARRLARVPLPILCYLLVWAIWLGGCVWAFASDGIAKANGTLQPFTLTLEDFALVDLEPLEGSEAYLATSYDPQLVWPNTAGKLRSFRFEAQIYGEGHEMCLYYTNPGDLEFSEDKRVWPVQQADGSYLFALPRTEIERLRLDPISIKNLSLEFGGFWLNEPQPALHYFNPGVWGLACLLCGPALLAAALRWLADTLRHYAAKTKNKKRRAAHG